MRIHYSPSIKKPARQVTQLPRPPIAVTDLSLGYHLADWHPTAWARQRYPLSFACDSHILITLESEGRYSASSVTAKAAMSSPAMDPVRDSGRETSPSHRAAAIWSSSSMESCGDSLRR